MASQDGRIRSVAGAGDNYPGNCHSERDGFRGKKGYPQDQPWLTENNMIGTSYTRCFQCHVRFSEAISRSQIHQLFGELRPRRQEERGRRPRPARFGCCWGDEPMLVKVAVVAMVRLQPFTWEEYV